MEEKEVKLFLCYEFKLAGLSVLQISFVRNHVKLLRIINSRRGFSKGTVLCGGYYIAMGLADRLGIADLHCRKVESTKWLKHKLRATWEASSLNKPMADLGFLFL
jgi:hypothetical protein